jgi:uncharacterized membrane protein YraQ (UPF0718 family)/copper chaperone CopZ
MLESLTKTIIESWLLFGRMAPYLLFGFLAAGIMSVCISPEWVRRHLGRHGFGAVLKASLFGIPLPLCSCSVIPVAISMRRHGASRAATTSFLLSTPQTGVDSVFVTYAMLGPIFALFRPVAALITGLLGGSLVHWFEARDAAEAAAPEQCAEACCAERGKRGVVGRVVRYSLLTLPLDLAGALLIGIVIAGAMTALIPKGDYQAYLGAGVGSILLLMLAGVPVYVCATASVPIAAGFMHLGATPGAALAFLIAGPATNAATFTTVWKALGVKTAAIYLFTIAVSAVACGLLLNAVTDAVATLPMSDGSDAHGSPTDHWSIHLWAAGLLALLGYALYRKHRHRFTRSIPAPSDDQADAPPSGITQARLSVSGMTCEGCVSKVQSVLAGCPGVDSATIDLDAETAVVLGADLLPDNLAAAVTAAGYPATAMADSAHGGAAADEHCCDHA